MYDSDASMKFPTAELQIMGRKLTFLVDSGATRSVIKQTDLPQCKPSGRYVYSISAAGTTVKEMFSEPVSCIDSGSQEFPFTTSIKHSFLLSSVCPINLIGRDLILRLGLNLISTPEGIQVTRNSYAMAMISQPTERLLYVYQWLVPLSIATELLNLAYPFVSPHAVFMTPSNLHCTAYVSCSPDRDFEKRFFLSEYDELLMCTLYWSSTRSAISVSLTHTQSVFYEIEHAVPHVSLSKAHTDSWKDLGPFVKQCEALTDWAYTQADNVLYSASKNVFKKQLNTSCSVHRFLHLTEDSYTTQSQEVTTSCFTDVTQLPAALSEVPHTVWASHKYDVGLIRAAEPVVIKPKSSYRPNLPQYPLKPEAVEGIRPVFDSLLKAGVIVPCPDSPVRTPVFPAKKIRDKGQPDEWRFVQDLRAFNAAVHARAPTVPNPDTILAQIPPNSQWFSVIDLSNAFFSVPVHPDSQYWFTFMYDGQPYTFTRLCQGYCESPTIYNQALGASLESLQLSPGTALIRYVDDLCLA